jgi:hypothetical protein
MTLSSPLPTGPIRTKSRRALAFPLLAPGLAADFLFLAVISAMAGANPGSAFATEKPHANIIQPQTSHIGAAAVPVLASGTVVTPAAAAELTNLCAPGGLYPGQTIWSVSDRMTEPPGATTGTARIEQYRNGQLIAVYTSFVNQPGCAYLGNGQDVQTPGPAALSGCGPFTRTHSYRLAADGDNFLVYPAIYSGNYNQPWIGPLPDSAADASAGIYHTPQNITISGVVDAANGNQRPVILLGTAAAYNTLSQAPLYIAASRGLTISNINVVGGPGANPGQAGIYIDGAANLTLRSLRVHSFIASNAHGILSSVNSSGTLTLDQIEVDHNGGPHTYADDVTVNASQNDPHFTLAVSGSYFHDAVLGHLLRSAAQNTLITGTYFEGGLPLPHTSDAESYLLDLPQGGNVSVRTSLFVKNKSGPDANGIAISYGDTGLTAGGVNNIDVENNDFVTYSATYDGFHPIQPYLFFWPPLTPQGPNWPAGLGTRILKNIYTGFCGSPYIGDIAETAAFSELAQNFTLLSKYQSNDAALSQSLPNYVPVTTTPTYQQRATAGAPRSLPTLGAMD